MARLMWFLGASFVLHGLLALALRGALTEVPGRPSAPAAPAEGRGMVWFEGPGAVQASTPSATPSATAVQAVTSVPAKASRSAPRAGARTQPPAVAATASVQPPLASPPAPPPEPGSEVEPPREQPPAQEQESPAEAPPGESVAEAAARGSGEEAPGAASGLSSGESGTASSGGAVGARSSAASGGGGQGGPALGDLRAYARRLGTVVAHQRRYPERAVRLRMQGTAHVQLRIRRDGSLMGPPRIVISSGQELLDAEALRMVEAAAPFEPMPDSDSRTDAGFVIPVDFSFLSHR